MIKPVYDTTANLLEILKNLYKFIINYKLIYNLISSGNFQFIKFVQAGHFYSPIPNMRSVCVKFRDNVFETSNSEISSINLNEASQKELLKKMGKFYSDIPFQDDKKTNLRYFFDNAFFSYGDGIVLYSFLRMFHPKKVVEIGSGFSSSLMLDTNDLFLNRQTMFTFIEPYPNRLLTLLDKSDLEHCNIQSKPVQNINLDIFTSLSEGDIFFVDSSHVAKIDSDILYIFFHILPALQAGVIVHFHDILWPFEYPENWLKEGRAWNEAYFLRAFLQYNNSFEILYFNSYMELHHRNLLQTILPDSLKTPTSKVTPSNTSLWLRKKHV